MAAKANTPKANASAATSAPGKAKLRKQPSPWSRRYLRFWVGFEVSNAKLSLFRVSFFLVFALDAWLQVAHAPRYGHLDFNVGHFSWLEALLPMPTRAMMLVVYTLQAYLGFRIALGKVSRLSYAFLAIVFGYGYFISQLNSYQHHYLLWIALSVLAFFPWPDLRPANYQEHKRSAKLLANWPVRFLLIALSVVYFYAAIAKFDKEWLDGSTLKLILHKGMVRDLADSVGFAASAKLVILVELGLAIGLHIRRAWPLVLPAGIGMHIAFETAGLRIGLFSYFMLTLYLLVLPESWIALAKKPFAGILGAAAKLGSAYEQYVQPLWQFDASRGFKGVPYLFAISLLFGFALVRALPVEAVVLTSLLILAIAAVDAWLRRHPLFAIHHLLACALLFVVAYKTEALRDYYRYWGGSLRRSGQLVEATFAYEHVVDIAPDYASGHRHLGDLYRRRGHPERALASYKRGLALEEDDVKLNQGAALAAQALGKLDEARTYAKRALQGDPRDAQMQRLAQ